MNQLQCDICNEEHNLLNCPIITGAPKIPDSPIPPKALLTVPELFVAIKTKAENDNETYEIKAKETILRGTTFGPLIAPAERYEYDEIKNVNPFLIKDAENQLLYLDTTDKNACNWMSLVRFTENGNAVCYVKENGIYFTVVHELQSSSELTVSYSKEYKKFIRSGLRLPDLPNTLNNIVEPSLILVVPDEEDIIEEANHRKTQTNVKPKRIKEKAKLHSGTKKSERKPKKPKYETKKTDSSTEYVDSNANKSEQILFKPPIERLSESQRRLGPLIALDEWKCKFCQLIFQRIPDLASHLTGHYKTVGAARTEKSRLGKKPKESVLNQIKVAAEHELSHLISNNDEVLPVYPYTCDICASSRTFNRAEYMIRHLRKHYIGEYFCQNCLKHYSTPDRLRNHVCYKEKSNVQSVDSETGNEPLDNLGNGHSDVELWEQYLCNLCHLKFPNEEALGNHLQTCSKELNNVVGKPDRYKCGLCQQFYSTLTLFDKHLKTHNSPTPCPLCSKQLNHKSLNNHTLICNALHEYSSGTVAKLRCPFCLESCEDLLKFHYHIPKHTHPLLCPSCHFRLESSDNLTTHRCRMFSCDGCTEQFESFIDLRNHSRLDQCKARYFCVDCSYPFVTKEGFNQHKVCELESVSVASHKPKKKKKPKEGKFNCEICGLHYNKWNSIKTHRATHGPKKFTCETCGKTFHRKEILAEHLFVHKPPEFECKDCGKKMKSKKSLEVHSRIHAGIKKFQCECGKAFTQKINLITHQMTHLPPEEKGFVCPHCGRKFSSREYLNSHIEVHEIGKTHICDICSKSFMKAHILMHHRRVAHGSKRYACEFCQLVLRQKHSLMRHCTSRHFETKGIWEREGYLDSRLVIDDGSSSTLENRFNPNSNSEETSSSAIQKNSVSDLELENANNLNNDDDSQQMQIHSASEPESGLTRLEIIGDCVQLQGAEDELMHAGIELGQSISFHPDGNIIISNEPSSVMILQVEDGDEYVLTLAPNTRNQSNFRESGQIQDVVLQHAEAIMLNSKNN